jgi:ribosomal protein L31E
MTARRKRTISAIKRNIRTKMHAEEIWLSGKIFSTFPMN